MAVATQMEGFRIIGELVPGLVFHTVAGIGGAQMLLVAARKADAENGVQPSEATGSAAPTA